jgi:hypothetical protein
MTQRFIDRRPIDVLNIPVYFVGIVKVTVVVYPEAQALAVLVFDMHFIWEKFVHDEAILV